MLLELRLLRTVKSPRARRLIPAQLRRTRVTLRGAGKYLTASVMGWTVIGSVARSFE